MEYTVGSSCLPNARRELISSSLPDSYADMEGYSVEFVADEDSKCILALTVKGYSSSQSHVQGSGYVSSANCAVVTEHPKNELLSLGYVELDVIDSSGAEKAIIARSAENGGKSTSLESIVIGDVIEYEYVGVIDIEGIGSTVVYDVNLISARPYVVLSESKAYTYHMGCSGGRFGLGKKASGQTEIEYDGQAIIGHNTRVLTFDGVTVRDITSSALKNGFERSVAAGYCMYLSINGESGEASLIYLREKIKLSSGANASDFTTVAYLSEVSVKDENVSYADGVYVYPHTVDLISGKSMSAYQPIDVSGGNYIQASGCYPAYIDAEGKLCLLSGEAFTSDVLSESVSYVHRAVVTAIEHDENGLITITANGETVKTSQITLFDLNQSRELVDYYNVALLLGGNYLVNGNYCIADLVIFTAEDGIAQSITVIIHII